MAASSHYGREASCALHDVEPACQLVLVLGLVPLVLGYDDVQGGCRKAIVFHLGSRKSVQRSSSDAAVFVAVVSDMTIRSAGQQDIGQVLQLWQAAGSSPSVTDSEAGLRALLAADPDALLVAGADGVPLGSLIAAWDGWRASFYPLVVDPTRRREGIATALLHEGERRLRARGAIRLTAIETGRRPQRGRSHEQRRAANRRSRPSRAAVQRRALNRHRRVTRAGVEHARRDGFRVERAERPSLILLAGEHRVYVLRGRVHCGLCGRRMEGTHQKGSNYYRCRVNAARQRTVRP